MTNTFAAGIWREIKLAIWLYFHPIQHLRMSTLTEKDERDDG